MTLHPPPPLLQSFRKVTETLRIRLPEFFIDIEEALLLISLITFRKSIFKCDLFGNVIGSLQHFFNVFFFKFVPPYLKSTYK